MASKLTVPEIINVANISGYLADNDVDANGTLDWGTLDSLLPVKIYEVKKSIDWGYNQNYIATKSKSNFAINGIGNENDIINIYSPDPILGLIKIGTYTLTSLDITVTLIAQNVAAAITNYGYTAISISNTVIVTAPLVVGNLINNLTLSIEYIVYVIPYILTESGINITAEDGQYLIADT